MTIAELIRAFDGYGLAITDEEMVEDRIIELGAAPFDEVALTTPGGFNANGGARQDPRTYSL